MTQIEKLPGPAPRLPNVADLASERDRLLGENAALRGYLDRAVLELSRCRGRTVECVRLEYGFPYPEERPRE